MKLFGGIEAGGTKFVCAIGDADGKIWHKASFPTTLPEATMAEVRAYFHARQKDYALHSIGVSCFGPLVLDQNSPDFGRVTAAQKKGWDDFNIVKSMRQEFNLPIGLDTDVNAAAVGEFKWGNGIGFDSMIYWTVGTGIGAGGILSGQIMHGLVHPEMGHTFVPHDRQRDPFPGNCPYHGDCLEGLAAGPAMQERWNIRAATDLPPDHPGWQIEAEYLGYAMANCILNVSPQRIILGGGVMHRKELYPMIRANTLKFLGNFIKHPSVINIDDFIVPPGLEGNAGVLGAIALAVRACECN